MQSHQATVLDAAQSIQTMQRTLPKNVPAGHVRLALVTASLCGTDLHYYRHFANAGFELQRPITLGHEACATVTGPNGHAFHEGQLVALNPIINCQTCAFCLAGEENHCANKKFPGSATTVPHIDGFFQAQFDFPAASCHTVPEGTNPDHLTFAEPLACAMHAVTMSGASAGSHVLVTGCGPMGLLAVVAAMAEGADVEVTDTRPEAVALALKIGAKRGYVANQDALPDSHFDAVIEASGAPQAFNQALEAVKRCGTLAILSNIQPSKHPINLHRIMLKEVHVCGSFQFNSEFKKAVALVTSGRWNFEELIAARYALADTGAALEFMLSGKAAGKILIKPEL